MVNGVVQRPSHRVAEGDRIAVEIVMGPSFAAEPQDMALEIVYRDANMVVIDKPAGLVVHPAPGHESGTLANALAGMFPSLDECSDKERPGIVHRLDKDTSGLMVAALSPAGQRSLQKQIRDRTMQRRYLALVSGRMAPEEGIIEAPIGRDVRQRQRMAVHGVAARPARTRYRVLREVAGFTLIEAKLDTGRTHQIRVHCAALGHPIAGDTVYGGCAIPGLRRQFLHAYRLGVLNPASEERLEFSSELPTELQEVLDSLA